MAPRFPLQVLAVRTCPKKSCSTAARPAPGFPLQSLALVTRQHSAKNKGFAEAKVVVPVAGVVPGSIAPARNFLSYGFHHKRKPGLLFGAGSMTGKSIRTSLKIPSKQLTLFL
ncbi:hypothetical protein K7I13_05620 [Brucepastera parasyntrophica]|uniref:hypothetical protein n=1 Tax=Brucepastera parasyntrophica TaxID=2880008 RepID=UPI002108BAF3|nr:hypothetical protein [Brucepastera parasyntrophica]ULQ60749.1 hypothetical protein K7I13_05620 [Brucepastera parasyntrophica]